MINKRIVQVFALIITSIFICLGRTSAQETTQWTLSNGIHVYFNQFGRIDSVGVSDGKLIGQGQLVAVLLSAGDIKTPLFQAWGTVEGDKVDMENTGETVTVKGVLGGQKTPDAPRKIEFTESYKKIADGVLLLHIEAIYLADVTSPEPLSYRLTFPVADYTGGACMLVDQDGVEKTYPIAVEALPLKGESPRSVRFSKGAWSVTLESVGNTALSVLDSRAWKGDALIVKAWTKQPWNTPFIYATENKQAFDVKITFKKANGSPSNP